MLVAIDGTGEADNNAYQLSMKNSFLNQLIAESPIYPKVYFRGPTWKGFECTDIVRQVMDWISLHLQYIPSSPELYLAGYSRGGAIAIAVAQEIRKMATNISLQYSYDRGSYLISAGHSDDFNKRLEQDIFTSWQTLNNNIKCMALFDAVDRAKGIETDVIPANVQMAYHAARLPTVGSRRSFGHTGLTHEDPNRLKIKWFFCTHAAMGGVPWTGDHPTTLTRPLEEFEILADPTFGYLPDVVRDEGLMVVSAGLRDKVDTLGTSLHVLEPLTDQNTDTWASQQVKEWMWANMKQHKMV